MEFFSEYDAVFVEPYATTISELYTGAVSSPDTKVALINCQTLSEKETTRKIDVKNL